MNKPLNPARFHAATLVNNKNDMAQARDFMR